MTKTLRAIGVGLLLLGLANSAAADVVLYVQSPLVYPPGQFPAGHDLVWSSMPFPPSPGFAGGTSLAYDSFRLSSPSLINTVTWEGGYFGPPTQVPITNFTLTFYNDAGGKPGTALATSVIPFANANQTNLHNEIGSTGANVLVADYSANLPTSFLANDNTPYWLSIQANIPGYGANQRNGAGTSDKAATGPPSRTSWALHRTNWASFGPTTWPFRLSAWPMSFPSQPAWLPGPRSVWRAWRMAGAAARSRRPDSQRNHAQYSGVI